MGRFIVRLLAVIGFLTLLLAAAGIGTVWYLHGGPEPDAMVLSVDFREPVADRPADDTLTALLTDRPPSLQQIVTALDRAAADPKVKALIGWFGDESFGLATAQELRDALARFRRSGKPAIAFADSFGEFGPANAAYYLASGFGQVWMRDIGMVGLTGIRIEVPFGRDALDQLGIAAQFYRRGPYKSFPESFTLAGFSDESRAMMGGLADDLYRQLVSGIAEGRALPPEAVQALIDQAPLSGAAAQSAGLIDRLGSRAAVEQAVADEAGAEAVFIDPGDYLEHGGTAPGRAPQIALIYATGTIVAGDGDQPFAGDVFMSADETARIIRSAARDGGIAALVLRIDSPGGSAVASEVVAEALRDAAAQKPVIISMGATAASGAYWIAAGATQIVAQPATLTGSIGVFAGKFDLTGLWQKLGIGWDAVQRGRNADLWSFNTPYSEADAAKVTAVVDDLYSRFVDLVAEGRHLDRAAVEQVAEGRVWTGAQALERGLVDRLGGLDAALDLVRQDLHLAAGSPLRLRVLPEPQSPFGAILGLLEGGAPGSALADTLARTPLAPALQAAASGMLAPEQRLLRMPPLAVTP